MGANVRYVELSSLLSETPRNGLYKGKEFQGSGHRWIKMGDVFSNNFLKNQRTELLTVNDSEVERFSCRPGDLLFGRTSLTLEGVGDCMLVAEINDEPIFESNIFRLRFDKRLASPLFYFYFFKSRYGKQLIQRIAKQTAAASITAADLIAQPVPYFELDSQNNVADIIRGFDEKIELNRRMNATLEAMAQALFKSWFVDFDPVIDNALAAGNPIPEELQTRADARAALGDKRKPLPEAIQKQFPSRFVFTEEIGWMPEGWQRKRLSDFAVKISKGTTPRHIDIPTQDVKQDIPFIKVKDLSSTGEIDIEGLERIPRNVHEGMLRRSILQPGDVLFSIAGTIGRCAIVPDELKDSNTNQAVAFVRPTTQQMRSYIYHFLKSEDVQGVVHSRIVQAVQANLSLTELRGLELLEPVNGLFDTWHERTKDLVKRAECLRREIRLLASARDTLLPKLLSGELRIPDAEKQVAEAV